MHEAADSRRAGSIQHVAGAIQVDAPQVAAPPVVAGQRHQMDDGIDALDSLRQGSRIGHVSPAAIDQGPLARGEPSPDAVTGRLVAGQGDDSLAVVRQARHDVTADEAAGAGHEDGRHGLSPPKGCRRGGLRQRFGRYGGDGWPAAARPAS